MIVLRYPCVPASSDDLAALRRQTRLGGDYRRALAEVENAARAAIAELYREAPGIRADEDAP